MDVSDLAEPDRCWELNALSDKKRVTERRFRGAIMPTGSHNAIRRVKRQGHSTSIHGNKLWNSSCLLIDYLHAYPGEHHQRVIDVGCGWGLAGIWCAKSLGSSVCSVDADSQVFPFLAATATLNGVTTKALVSRFESLSTQQLSHFDMLIAADICFWEELIDPVFNLINRAVNAGVKKILIADPERSTFFTMAEKVVEKHGAELLDWKTHSPLKASGAILVLENT